MVVRRGYQDTGDVQSGAGGVLPNVVEDVRKEVASMKRMTEESRIKQEEQAMILQEVLKALKETGKGVTGRGQEDQAEEARANQKSKEEIHTWGDRTKGGRGRRVARVGQKRAKRGAEKEDGVTGRGVRADRVSRGLRRSPRVVGK